MVKKISDITKFTGGYLKKDRHYPRVRDDLEKYLIWYSTPEILGVEEHTTPKVFFELSNKKFNEIW